MNVFAGTGRIDDTRYGQTLTSTKKSAERQANQGRAPPRETGVRAEKKYSREYSGKNVEWAVNNDIISENERTTFFHKIADVQKLGHKYRQTANGNYILEIGNKLLFTDADWKSPSLYMVVSFSDSSENSMLYAKEIVFNEARTEADYNRARQIIEDAYWPGYVEFSYSRDYKADVGQIPGRERSNSKRDNEEFIKYSLEPEEAKVNVKRAEEYFGTTYKVKEAGYITTDGKMLDFSGRHEGAPGGYRTVDHRDITDALGEEYGGDDYSGGMVQFMREGNIRVSPEMGGINLSVAPNKAQRSTLDRYISSFRGEVILDIDEANGDIVASVEYPKYTLSSVVLKDIDDYFGKGKVPEKFSLESKQLTELRRENRAQACGGYRSGYPKAKTCCAEMHSRFNFLLFYVTRPARRFRHRDTAVCVSAGASIRL